MLVRLVGKFLIVALVWYCCIATARAVVHSSATESGALGRTRSAGLCNCLVYMRHTCCTCASVSARAPRGSCRRSVYLSQISSLRRVISFINHTCRFLTQLVWLLHRLRISRYKCALQKISWTEKTNRMLTASSSCSFGS